MPRTQTVTLNIEAGPILSQLSESLGSAILVWRWKDAPESLRALSCHGGDEDWVAFIPSGIDPDDVWWAWEGSQFGVDTENHEVDGGVVRIGAHA